MKRAAFLCAAILGGLAALHLYWARGGTAFAEAAVPRKLPIEGEASAVKLFAPGPVATYGVALGLSLAALAVLRAGFTRRGRLAACLVALLFAGRAAGDFRYVGFTKKVRGTEFARRDDMLYSPLCVAVAVLAARAAK